MPTLETTVSAGEVATLSWGAVIAGAVASAALSLVLIALGVGLGFAVVSPWSDQGISSSTLVISAGIYLIAVAMIASTVGGYLAGRLRMAWVGVHAHEVYFRDSAHGFLVWALATVLSVSILGGATTHLLASASTGAIPAATAGAGAAAANGPADTYVDGLLRADPATNAGTATANPGPAGGDRAALRGELGRILAPAITKGGDVSADDRSYVAKVVAARAGVSQADAERRVSDIITQAKTTADNARSAAAKLSLWLVVSMLAGALSASLAAIEGGILRDSRWYEPGWNRRQARAQV
ncbi:MAG: hypothetical protein ACXWJW_11825 [Xanthobacteraceae bacterium]